MSTQDSEDQSHPVTRRLSTTIARILREMSRDFDRRVTRKLHARGHRDISLSHQVVFSNLGLGRTRVTELAQRAQITQQAMGKTLRELEEHGYVERALDAKDRRARTIRLTEKGLRLADDTVDCIEQVRAEYAEKIGRQELDTLDASLRAAVSKLELGYLPADWAKPGPEQG